VKLPRLFNGQDCVALAEKYGTPLSVTSEARVVERPPWQK